MLAYFLETVKSSRNGLGRAETPPRRKPIELKRYVYSGHTGTDSYERFAKATGLSEVLVERPTRLGLKRTSLAYKMQKLGISRPPQ